MHLQKEGKNNGISYQPENYRILKEYSNFNYKMVQKLAV